MAGGIPLILSRVEGTIDEMLDVVDACVIGGGRDIDPTATARSPTSSSGQLDPQRDGFELELVERSLDRGLPLLGMCRGARCERRARRHARPGRELCARVGGAPDRPGLAAVEGGRARVRSNDEPDVPEHPRHAMSVEPGSRLHAALGVDEIEVNSFHHQAIETPRRPACERPASRPTASSR